MTKGDRTPHDDAFSIRVRLFWTIAPLIMHAFFISFKPSSPFLAPYVIREIGMSKQMFNRVFVPITTVVSIPLLLVAAPASIFLPIPLILLAGWLSHVAVRVLLLFATNTTMVLISQVFWAGATTSGTVLNSAVFPLTLDPSLFQHATSLIRGAILLSHTVSGLLGQVILFFVPDHMRYLFIISAASIGISVVFLAWYWIRLGADKPTTPPPRSPIIPSPSRLTLLDPTHPTHPTPAGPVTVQSILRELLESIVHPFRTGWGYAWCLTIGHALHSIIISFVPVVFNEEYPTKSYNGIALTVGRLTGFLGCVAPLAMQRKYSGVVRKTVPAITAICCGVIALPLWLNIPGRIGLVCSYIAYSAYYFFAEIVFTICTAELAAHVHTRQYPAVFCLNSAVGCAVEAFLQLIIESAVGLDEYQLFPVIGVLWGMVALVVGGPDGSSSGDGQGSAYINGDGAGGFLTPDTTDESMTGSRGSPVAGSEIT